MPDPCVTLRNKVATSAENVADLKSQMEGATGALKHGLARQLVQAESQLDRDRAALAECEKATPPATPPPPPPPGHPPPSGPPTPKDPCLKNRARVAKLNEQIAELKDQIAGATGAVLHSLAGQLTLARNQLAREEEALAACEGTLLASVPPKCD